MSAAFHKFESPDSVPYSSESDGVGSSAALSAKRTQSNGCGDDQAGAAPLTVAVSIRRGRLVVLSTLVLAALVAIVFVLKQGVELSHFDASTKNATARERLLNDYNSYCGNVASAFGRPIEIFVALLAQLFSLQIMAHAFTQPTISWRQVVPRLLLSAAISYLVSNGFNAANVQLREMPIHAVITVSDLSVATTLNTTVAARTTSVANTVSEETPGNLITNTVLRNAVLPRVGYKQTICDWEANQVASLPTLEIPIPTIDYGFTQRDWQSRLLQEALPAKRLKVVVNATNTTVNKDVKSSESPMNASLAADLFLYMMTVGPTILPGGKVFLFVDKADLVKRYPPDTPQEEQATFREKTAIVTGLLPPSTNKASESEQRDWLLKAIPIATARQFTNATRTSRRGIVVEFSHVAISPTIDFDAMTIETEIDPSLLATATSRDGSTRYTQVFQSHVVNGSNCGPWLVADSIVQNQSDNATNTNPRSAALITNLRKIYTISIGRVSWRLENLATLFGADCGTKSTTQTCLGLQMPLAASTLSASEQAIGRTASPQRLVLHAEGLSTRLIFSGS